MPTSRENETDQNANGSEYPTTMEARVPEEIETATTNETETPQAADDSETRAAMEARMPTTSETEITIQDEALSTANDNESNREDQASATREQLFEQCGEIASSEDVLKLFAEQLHGCGLVGEEVHAKLLYMILHTRFFSEISSAVIKGPSSGGKSHLLKTVLKFVPKNSYLARTGMSEKAIIYGKSDIRHKHLVIYEAAGINNPGGLPYLRSLLSEGHIRYETTDVDNLRTNMIERPGPTGLLMTTTETYIHPEDESRLLSFEVDDSGEQTRNVLLMKAREAAGQSAADEPDFAPWHVFSRWLELGSKEVAIPFAEAMVNAVRGPQPPRIKRDFVQLISLVKAHALIHQKNREKDESGSVIYANISDYAAVRVLVERIMSDSAQATVASEIRETVQAVQELYTPNGVPIEEFLKQKFDDPDCSEGVPQNALVEKLRLDPGTVSRRVKRAMGLGYLDNLEKQKGRPSRLVPLNPLPEEQHLLPTAEEVEKTWDQMRRESTQAA